MKFEEEENGDGEKKQEEEEKWEWEKKWQKILISSSFLLVYIKQGKVKDIFDFGGNYPNVPPLLPTLQTSPIAF